MSNGAMMLGALQLANPVAVTSASGVVTLNGASNSFIVSGTENVTAISGGSDITQGMYTVIWNTDRTLVHNASSLILIGGADKPVKAGDAGIYEINGGVVTERFYQPAAGYAAKAHDHDAVTQSSAGFMSAADKAKLDGLAGVFINVKDDPYNAKGDGTSDDTAAIQAAIDAAYANGGGTVYIPTGTYMINGASANGSGLPVNGLSVPSNTHIVMSPKATLKLITNNTDTYTVLLIKDGSNIVIEGGNIVGDLQTHLAQNGKAWKKWTANTAYSVGDTVYNSNGKGYTCTVAGTTGSTMPDFSSGSATDGSVTWTYYMATGQWGMGITIYGGSNITIKDVNFSQFWGDGIYVDGDFATRTTSCVNNLKIIGVTSTYNRRQGMSIIFANGVTVSNSTFAYTSGQSPQCGIDLEPNYASQSIKNIKFIGCHFDNNAVHGFVFSGVQGNLSNVVIEDCAANSNGANGFSFNKANDCTISNCIVSGNAGLAGIYIGGTTYNVTVSNNQCVGNATGILLTGTAYDNVISGNQCVSGSYAGIELIGANVNNNTVTGNNCYSNTSSGIYLTTSSNNNSIVGNVCKGNTVSGIYLSGSATNCTVHGNTCSQNTQNGITLSSCSNHIVSGNNVTLNGTHGILVSALTDSAISNNYCLGNSQTTNGAAANIEVTGASSYVSLLGNTCRQGSQTNKPNYGVWIASASSTGVLIANNDLYQGGASGGVYDSGTGTIYGSNRNTSGYYAGALGYSYALTAGTTVTVNFSNGNLFTLTPAQNCTLNASGGYLGQTAAIEVVTSGTTSYTLTFGTNFKSQGTLTTGTTSGKYWTVNFQYDGTNWVEIGRTTTAM